MPALIILAYLSLLTLGLLDNMRGPFYPEILQDLKLSATAGGAFYGVTSLFAFLGSLLCHRISKGRNTLLVLGAASFIFAIGYGGISRSGEFFTLLLFCAVFGWAYGMINVLQNVMVCEASTPANRRRLLNGLQSMYSLAALLAPLTATAMRSGGFSWREVFFALAFFPAVVALLSFGLRAKGAVDNSPDPTPFNRREWLLCSAFAAILSVYLWGELAISTRLVIWLRTQREFTPDAADFQLAIFFLGLLAGRLGLAFVPLARIGNIAILMFAALCTGILFLIGLHHSPYLLAVCGLTISPFFPVLMDETSKAFGAKSSQAVGMVIGVGNLSILLMHMAIGSLTDIFDLTTALHAGPVALLLVGFALAGVKIYHFGK